MASDNSLPAGPLKRLRMIICVLLERGNPNCMGRHCYLVSDNAEFTQDKGVQAPTIAQA